MIIYIRRVNKNNILREKRVIKKRDWTKKKGVQKSVSKKVKKEKRSLGRLVKMKIWVKKKR